MFAVLHVSDFPLHAVLRAESVAAHRPAALFDGSKKKSLALALNPAARAAGVELGMTAPQAVARCSSLLIRTAQPGAEAEARAALLAVGFTLSPNLEDTAPGICTVDVRGVDPAKRASRAAQAIERLGQLGLPATAGIGRTPLLALFAARAAEANADHVSISPGQEPFRFPPPRPKSTGSARAPAPEFKSDTAVAEDSLFGSNLSDVGGPAEAGPPRDGAAAFPELEPASSKPLEKIHAQRGVVPPLRDRPHPIQPSSDGLPNCQLPTANYPTGSAGGRVLAITDEKHFLAPIPLPAAEPSPELAQVLSSWGLRTFGDLTALPRDEIIRRFGAEGLDLWKRATGGVERPLHLVTPAQTFSATLEFEEEVETLEPLLFVLRRFLERLTLELRAAQLVATELELTLTLENETALARQFRLPEPTGDTEILFRALHSHLESLRTDSSVSAVSLRLQPARPLVRQQGLFETGLRDPHGFAETLARVAAIVGADNVGAPKLEDTHRPDAFRIDPPAPVIPPAADPPIHPPLGLTLRRFRPPLPVKLELSERGPTYAWTDQFHGTIVATRGPWQSSGEWWQTDRAWSRIEWDIALADGGVYRLIQNGEVFFIEGEYD